MHSTIKLNKKNSKEYSLSLKFNPNQKPKHFISYLESLLDIKKNPLSSTIHFKCYKAETLKELLTEKKNNLSYRHLLLMFLQLGQQLKELARDKIGILKINIEDIIVVHMDKEQYKSKFIFKNSEYFHSLIYQDNEMTDNLAIEVYKPYDKKNLFLSPELYHNNNIPFYISTNSSYYSLSLLICYCLQPYDDVTKIYNMDFIKTHIESIKETKLYWGILRCLEEDPNNRYYLYI